MGILTLGEKRKIKEGIRNDSSTRQFFGALDSILKSGNCSIDVSTFPVSIETARIYNGEINKQCMKLAKREAEKSKCMRRKVGAVLEKDGAIIGKGYNGVPYGLTPCTVEVPCFKVRNHVKSGSVVDDKYCSALHAEEFAIIDAAKRGKSTTGSRLFCTHEPCLRCSLQIVAADITEVYYLTPYPDKNAREFRRKAKVKTHHIKN